MMSILALFSLAFHIITGSATLLAGPIAIFYNFRNPAAHKLWGKIFFYSMLATCISSFTGFLKLPGYIFYQFLLGIAMLVLFGIITGVRAIKMMKTGKNKPWVDWALTIGLGICMLVMAAGGFYYQFIAKTGSIFGILMLVFSGIMGINVVENVNILRKYRELPKWGWYQLHIDRLCGSFAASVTAFLVNVVPGMPWYCWFLPTVAMIAIGKYYSNKVAPKQVSA